MRRFNPDTVQNGHIYSYIFILIQCIHILGLLLHFLWVRLRILAMNKMSLEAVCKLVVLMQMEPDIFIFSYKRNFILLFFIKSKFN